MGKYKVGDGDKRMSLPSLSFALTYEILHKSLTGSKCNLGNLRVWGTKTNILYVLRIQS